MSSAGAASQKSSMTKEQLKNALVQAGVPSPPGSAKKEEFQRVYNEKVLPLHSQSEFSSDDEQDVSSQNGNGFTIKIDANEAFDEVVKKIKKYSNPQIYAMCMDLLDPANVGPVIDSTRPVYINMIAKKVIDGVKLNLAKYRDAENPINGSPSSTHSNGYSDSDDEAAVETASRASRSSRGSNRSTPKSRGRISVSKPETPVTGTPESTARQNIRVSRRSETPKTSGTPFTTTVTTEETTASYRRSDMRGILAAEAKTVGGTGGLSYFKERPGYASVTASNILPLKPSAKFSSTSFSSKTDQLAEEKDQKVTVSTRSTIAVRLLAVTLAIVIVAILLNQFLVKEEQIKDELDQILETMEEQQQ